MYECNNCGMLPDACVCLPWCATHSRWATPCDACMKEGAKSAALAPFIIPWWEAIKNFILFD
jgi:hypothetical protein